MYRMIQENSFNSNATCHMPLLVSGIRSRKAEQMFAFSVYMCVCTYIHMIHVYVHTHVRAHASTNARTNIYLFINISTIILLGIFFETQHHILSSIYVLSYSIKLQYYATIIMLLIIIKITNKFSTIY